jgi:hypothetical protein
MATVDDLWQMAHELYARARTSIDPATKRMLMRAADDYLRQAEAMRRGQLVTRAEYPNTVRKMG